MADQSSVATYFEQALPDAFAATIAGTSEAVTTQPELLVTYEITGDNGGVYGVRVLEWQLEVVPGGFDTSDMRIIMNSDDWQASRAHDDPDPIISYVRHGKVTLIKSTRGTVHVDLSRPDGPNHTSTIVFGEAAEPQVTLMMTAEHYAQMMRGQLNGQMAFLTGKLKFDGSLPLLMQVGALNA